MFDLGFVVGLEGFVGGSDQIRFRLNAVSVVVNNPTAALAKLVVNGPFDLSEFIGGQFRQYGLDFSNRAHADKIIANESDVNGGRPSNFWAFCASLWRIPSIRFVDSETGGTRCPTFITR